MSKDQNFDVLFNMFVHLSLKLQIVDDKYFRLQRFYCQWALLTY